MNEQQPEQGLEALLRHPATTFVKVGWGYVGVESGHSVYQHWVIAENSQHQSVGRFDAGKGTVELSAAIQQQLKTRGWLEYASDIDPRGGIEGEIAYQRREC